MSIHKSRSSSSLAFSMTDEEGEKDDSQGDDTNEGSWVAPFIGSYHQYLNTTAKSRQVNPVSPVDIVRTQCKLSPSYGSANLGSQFSSYPE